MTPYQVLAAMLRADQRQAAQLRDAHRPDVDGCCPLCRGGGDSSGHQHGCTLYWVAVVACRRETALPPGCPLMGQSPSVAGSTGLVLPQVKT